MSRPSESALSFNSVGQIDIGNTAANVAMFLVPCRCVLDLVCAGSDTAQTSNAILTFDVVTGSSRSANAAGVVTIAASSSAGAIYKDTSGRGLVLNAGDIIMVDVEDAGDSGEKVCLAVLAHYEPNSDDNESSTLTES